MKSTPTTIVAIILLTAAIALSACNRSGDHSQDSMIQSLAAADDPSGSVEETRDSRSGVIDLTDFSKTRPVTVSGTITVRAYSGPGTPLALLAANVEYGYTSWEEAKIRLEDWNRIETLTLDFDKGFGREVLEHTYDSQGKGAAYVYIFRHPSRGDIYMLSRQRLVRR